MATNYFVNAQVVIAPMDTTYSFLQSPPVSWPIIASDMNLDPDTNIDGRYIEANTGQIEGVYNPKMQDTYINGTGGRTGRAFTVVSGTWKDDFVDPTTNKYALLMPDSTSAVTYDIRSTSITPAIENADIVINRGIPPVGAARQQNNYTCYIELAYNSSNNTGYRIAMEWGQPIRLDRTTDNGATWYKGVSIARELGNLEYFLASCGGQVKFRIRPDTINNTLTIEINNGDFLFHKPVTNSLPAPGNIRISGTNGSLSFGYLPLRAQPIEVNGNIKLDETYPNASNAFFQHNSLGYPAEGQTTETTVTTDDNQNFAYTVMASQPDSGDGLGSLDTPILANVTMIIPAVWTDSLSGIPPLVAAQQLPNRTVEELHIFDDATRCQTSSAFINVDNQYGAFNGAYGHQAVRIDTSVGGSYYPRFTGVAGETPEGIDISTIQTWGRMGLPCQGRECVMNKAPAIRRLYDGWCLYSAVRFEAELGNIHPRFLNTIPLYIPPGGTYEAPYGEAGSDCPYPILAKGSGLNARYDFGPEVPPWTVLQIFAQENGQIDLSSGMSLPFYMGFSVDGQFHFEAYDPSLLTPVITYSDIDPSGIGQIDGELHVYNSCAAMRTDIDFQGIDQFTYELLVGHITQPIAVKQAIGYRYPWLERNARYSDQYLQQMMQVASAIAARPQQVLKFKVPFQPYVFAGNVCFVESQQSLGGSGRYVIIELQSKYGMASNYGNSGIRESYSIVTCRSINEYPRSSFLT